MNETLKEPAALLKPPELIAGELDYAAVIPAASGWQVELNGWIVCRHSEIAELQLGIHNSPLVRASWFFREDFARLWPSIPHARRSGFRALLPAGRLRTDDLQVFFIARLSAGGSVVGSFTPPREIILPETAAEEADPPVARIQTAAELREHFDGLSLAAFLAGSGMLSFERPKNPAMSIILGAGGPSRALFAALKALSRFTGMSFELLVADMGLTWDNPELFERVKGAQFFLRPAGADQDMRMAAAAAARSEHLLFVSCGAMPSLQGAAAALQTLASAPETGAVFADLKTAAGESIQPAAPALARPVDSSDGNNAEKSAPTLLVVQATAPLLTRRSLFYQLAGFDSSFTGSIFEAFDYCLRLKAQGWKAANAQGFSAVIAERSGERLWERAPAAARECWRRFYVRHGQSLR